MINLILIGFLVALLSIGFVALHFIPALIIKWRASTLGLNLTIAQARLVSKGYCNEKDFLLCVKDIWFWTDIPIDKLIQHYHAKGNMINLRDGIIEMIHKNQNVSFETLSAFDLAGRNLLDEIKKAESNNWIFRL